jgi:eukaryotic-like serine/threonine-protein kinase
MKPNRLILSILILLTASLLSACAGGAGFATSWPGLSADEDTAYVAFNNHVYAIALDTGLEKWRFPAESNNRITLYADPSLSPDRQLIVGGYNNVLYSLNPDTGQMNWEFAQAGNKYIASPLAVEQGIFAPNADNNLYAFDLNGSLRWKFNTQGEIWAQPVTDPDCDCIYLTSMDHQVYALDPSDGSLRWQSEELGGAIVGSPALSEDGILYVGTFGREIIALDTEDGSVIWRTPTGGWVWSGPALVDDRLYGGDLDGNFYAINAADGQELWNLTPDQLDGAIAGSPVIIDDTIYFSSESGSIYALDTAGRILWSQAIGGRMLAAPVPAGDLLLVVPNQADQLLVAVTQEGGARRWIYTPEK